MRASHRWLMELSRLDVAPGEVAARLTAAGIEVEAMREVGRGLDGVVIAEVRDSRPHPKRDRLHLVRVDDGTGESEVVCGAPNVPGPGARVVLARVGVTLPGGLTLAEREIAGVVSRGMLLGEVELGVGSDAGGILVVTDDTRAAPGTPVADALLLGDTVYELSLTPNRPDALGHVGLARELCALFDRPFAWPAVAGARCVSAPSDLFAQSGSKFSLPLGPTVSDVPAPAIPPVRVDVSDPVRCSRYGAALVLGVRTAPSPFAVRYRLHVLGLRAISNVVDATNLILLGFGHPIHAFDFDRLRGARIEVRRARPGERMRTLDGEARMLVDDDLLICDGEGPVALAGVMGGAGSEIGPETQRVLIECAYFEPRGIRRTSKRTGLHTDSSHRFERGVDPSRVREVLAQAASWIARLSGGVTVSDALDVVAGPILARDVSLRHERVEGMLAAAIEARVVERVLTGLGCTLDAVRGGWRVRVPAHRPDLVREVDLIEEVARVRGYDSIPTVLPPTRPSEQGTPDAIGFVRRTREAAAGAGLDEAINYAFTTPTELGAARVSSSAVRVANPLSEERSHLRTALLPGLAGSLRRAQHQRLDRFAQFELARVFAPREGEPLPDERYELALLFWGPRRVWYSEAEAFDVYDAKAAVEGIALALGARTVATVEDASLDASAAYLHPRRRARIDVDSVVVGDLGELHPDVVGALRLEGRPVFASLDVERMREAIRARGDVRAPTLPRFPAVTRDLAVVVPEAREAGAVVRALAEAGGPLIEGVRLFDIYRGVPVPEGHKSLAFRVVYRDPDTTLTDERVDGVHAALVRAAAERFGAELRG
jgi:phenylalanyl-tRNA synthetase beta chain